jgi:hypothetical protein
MLIENSGRNWVWDSEQFLTHSNCLIGIGIFCIEYRVVFIDYLICFMNNIHFFPTILSLFLTLQVPSPSHIHYPLPFLKIKL